MRTSCFDFLGLGLAAGGFDFGRCRFGDVERRTNDDDSTAGAVKSSDVDHSEPIEATMGARKRRNIVEQYFFFFWVIQISNTKTKTKTKRKLGNKEKKNEGGSVWTLFLMENEVK